MLLTICLFSISRRFTPFRTLWPTVPATQYPGIISCSRKKNGLGHCGVKSFKVLDPFLLQNMFILNEYEWMAYTISSAYMHVYIYKQAVLMNFNFYKHIRRNAHYQAHNKRSRKSVCNTIIFLICIQRINAFKKYL